METEKICETCKYFTQHYRKWGSHFREVGCGHCTHPRVKKRTKYQTCSHWVAAGAPPSGEKSPGGYIQ